MAAPVASLCLRPDALTLQLGDEPAPGAGVLLRVARSSRRRGLRDMGWRGPVSRLLLITGGSSGESTLSQATLGSAEAAPSTLGVPGGSAGAQEGGQKNPTIRDEPSRGARAERGP